MKISEIPNIQIFENISSTQLWENYNESLKYFLNLHEFKCKNDTKYEKNYKDKYFKYNLEHFIQISGKTKNNPSTVNNISNIKVFNNVINFMEFLIHYLSTFYHSYKEDYFVVRTSTEFKAEIELILKICKILSNKKIIHEIAYIYRKIHNEKYPTMKMFIKDDNNIKYFLKQEYLSKYNILKNIIKKVEFHSNYYKDSGYVKKIRIHNEIKFKRDKEYYAAYMRVLKLYHACFHRNLSYWMRPILIKYHELCREEYGKDSFNYKCYYLKESYLKSIYLPEEDDDENRYDKFLIKLNNYYKLYKENENINKKMNKIMISFDGIYDLLFFINYYLEVMEYSHIYKVKSNIYKETLYNIETYLKSEFKMNNDEFFNNTILEIKKFLNEYGYIFIRSSRSYIEKESDQPTLTKINSANNIIYRLDLFASEFSKI